MITPINNSFVFLPVETAEVKNAITSLKNVKSNGSDGISSKIFKATSDLIAEPLVYLINHSVSTGCFPSILKIGTIIPILKKDDPDNIQNYRPITILSALSKVIERVVYVRIVNFLNKYSLLTENQFGFRAERSTETAANSFLEFVYKKLDAGYETVGLFFDLSAAFDTLNIDFLCDKLHAMGFRGSILNWLRSYLSDRKICVKIKGTESKQCNMNVGVPQGSVLGPLLFLIYINDLPNHIEAEKIVMFADDMSFVVSAQTTADLEVKIKNIFETFEKWCRSNLLIMNADKTVIVKFSLQSCAQTSYKINLNLELKSQKFTKFLGLYLNSTLDWSEQIDNICTKINKSYFALSRMKKILDLKSLIDLYYSLVYSHLIYNIALWGGASSVSRVFISQKKCVRLIFNLKGIESCRPTFISNKILTVPSIYILKTLLYVKENLEIYPTNNTFHNYSTRAGHLLSVVAHKTKKYENAPSYISVKLFNRLPGVLRDKPMKLFKAEIKNILASKAYYSVNEFLSESFY